MKPAHALSLLALLGSPGAAWAQRDLADNEETLVRQGIELRREGRDEAAAGVLRRAHALRGSPRATGQLALAEQALGRWARAEWLLRSALSAAEDPWVARNREVLQGALAVAEQHLATVEVIGGEPGAELSVDGEPVGTLPLARALRVAAGSARVSFAGRDGVVVTRVLELAPRGVARVNLPAGSPAPPAAVAAPAPRSARLALAAPAGPRSPGHRVHPVLWAGAGVSGAAGVALAAVWAAGESTTAAYEGDCVRASSPNVSACDARRVAEQSRLDALGAATEVAWWTLGAGVLSCGVGLALTLARPSGHTAGVMIAPMARGLTVRGEF